MMLGLVHLSFGHRCVEPRSVTRAHCFGRSVGGCRSDLAVFVEGDCKGQCALCWRPVVSGARQVLHRLVLDRLVLDRLVLDRLASDGQVKRADDLRM